MNKLINKNRKAEMMAKLQVSLEKYDNFKLSEEMSEGEVLKQSSMNEEVSRELSKMLQSNQRRKNDLKQRLITGTVGIDLNEQMRELRQRMDILRSHHRQKRGRRSYQSLTGKDGSQQYFSVSKWQKSRQSLSSQRRTFNELYEIQKEKYSGLRQRRKSKRLNLGYLDVVSSREGRKERNKQLIEEKFNKQMRMLDEAIGGG